MKVIKSKTTITFVLFFLISATDIYAVISKNELLELFFKPLLMISLLMVYLVSVKKPNFWFVSTLFFSFWGDVFLLFKEQFFILGLASFLIAHVLYIKITVAFLPKISIRKIAVISIPFLLVLSSLFYIIKDNLGEMLIPVLVYGITISSFGLVTLLNYNYKKSTENLWLFLGAVIFIVSDSLIAINRFYEAQELYSILIIITYLVAQYIICKAMIAKTSFQ